MTEQLQKKRKEPTVNIEVFIDLLDEYMEKVHGINISKATYKKLIFAAITIIKELVFKGHIVSFRGFGVFSTSVFKERTVPAGLADEPTYVEEHKVPRFKASPMFKKLLRYGVDYEPDKVTENN
jgi:nucleoid DNA-binding protein